MNKMIFLQSINEVLHKLNQLIKKHQVPDTDAIHDIRVTIKKYRALLTFAQFVSGKVFSKSKHYAYMSPLYSQSGICRNLFVSREWIINHRTELLQYYDKMIWIHYESEFNKLLPFIQSWPYDELAQSNAELSDTLSELDDSDIIAFITQRNRRIKKLLSKKPDDIRLHQIRKDLKKITTMQSLLESKNKSSKQKEMAQKIGDWHDGVVCLQLFHQFVSKDILNDNNTLKKHLNNLEKANNKIRDRLYRKISLSFSDAHSTKH